MVRRRLLLRLKERSRDMLGEMRQVRMRVPDHYIERLKGEIVTLRAMLEPLESGKMRIGERRLNEPSWLDATNAQIHHLKTTIAMYEAIVDSAEANGS